MLALPEGHTNMRAWLYRVARNLFLNEYRKNKNIVSFENAEGVLEKLKPKEREVLKLQYLGGLLQKEIASILNISPENVRILSYRGKKDIRKYLDFEKGEEGHCEKEGTIHGEKKRIQMKAKNL